MGDDGAALVLLGEKPCSERGSDIVAPEHVFVEGVPRLLQVVSTSDDQVRNMFPCLLSTFKVEKDKLFTWLLRGLTSLVAVVVSGSDVAFAGLTVIVVAPVVLTRSFRCGEISAALPTLPKFTANRATLAIFDEVAIEAGLGGKLDVASAATPRSWFRWRCTLIALAFFAGSQTIVLVLFFIARETRCTEIVDCHESGRGFDEWKCPGPSLDEM